MSDTPHLLQAAGRHLTPNTKNAAFIVERGEGAWLYDTEGTKYLDFATGIGVAALGHAHPAVVEAVSTQVARVAHTGPILHHRPGIELAQKLAEVSFGERVFFANSGTEATEAALKLARRHFHDKREKRHAFIAVEGGFHGRTMGALSVTAKLAYREGFGPLIPGVRHVPHADIEALDAAITDETAAVIMEPILGNSGVVIPPPGYLAAVREICTKRGALLIFDEVQTGIGRTGQWFAHQHDGVTPDIMALAKGLGGGLPLGAIVTTDALAEAFQPGVHASTFGGNPVACAAGLATLRTIEKDDLLAHGRALGQKMLEALEALRARLDFIVATRGRGMMLAVELDRPAKPYVAACREQGLLVTLAGDNVLRLLPPLILSENEAETGLVRFEAALRSL